MSAMDRVVAGLRCAEVLELLSVYLDGELEADRVSQIRAHTQACSTCARFGGRFARAVEMLRTETEPEALPDALVERLVSGAVTASKG